MKTPRSGRTRPDASQGGKSAGGESAGRESGRGKKVHRTSSSFSSSEQRRRRSLSRIARQQQKGALALPRKPGKAPSSRAGRGVGRSVPLFLGEGRTGRRPGRRCSRASGPTRFRPLAFFLAAAALLSLARFSTTSKERGLVFALSRAPLSPSSLAHPAQDIEFFRSWERTGKERALYVPFFGAQIVDDRAAQGKSEKRKEKNRRRSLSVAFRPLSSS